MHTGWDPPLPNQGRFAHASKQSSKVFVHEGVKSPNTRMGSPEDMLEGVYGVEKLGCLKQREK